MTITTQKTLCGKYIISASYKGSSFKCCNGSRKKAFSGAVDGCYEFIEGLK